MEVELLSVHSSNWMKDCAGYVQLNLKTNVYFSSDSKVRSFSDLLQPCEGFVLWLFESTPAYVTLWVQSHLPKAFQERLTATWDGFFVECGANNGVFQSNTLFLEVKRNWTGLLVEANPRLIRKLLFANRQVNFVYLTIAELPFFMDRQQKLPHVLGRAARRLSTESETRNSRSSRWNGILETGGKCRPFARDCLLGV